MTNLGFKDFTDEQLVEQFQCTGDGQVFGEIYNRHYKKVYHTCLGIVKDRDTACDLTQDVMVKVMEALPRLKHANLLGYWVYRIAHNESIQHCKDQRKWMAEPINENFDQPLEGQDEEEMEKKENLLNGMEKVIGLLNESDRQFISLKYFEDLSVEDLQKRFSLSESAVKMRLARARSRMAKYYQIGVQVAIAA